MSKIAANKISEKELIEHCISNKREYQEMLYRRYADKMYNVSITYTKDEDDASDVLQKSFIKVFRNLKKFKQEGSLEGWIRRIVINTAIEHFRKEKREAEVIGELEYTSSYVAENALDKLNYNDLIKLVNNLPRQAGMVLKLFVIEGYSHNDIAEIMKISVGTSKSQLNRARNLLQESIMKLNG